MLYGGLLCFCVPIESQPVYNETLMKLSTDCQLCYPITLLKHIYIDT